ncbi:PAS domain S-box-containing protein/diguanylate cyclase (GGDEF) domain-containing protein [Roseateles sp. YR242]|uniref:sensor domain-containing diguanylate cyclase n=1 Tax=Roseateles sp. YR242 TaxID=1855305 RepID=UPI0008D244E9|nr:diguanylate cyclase [Roseateles sp. YR242]SEL63318.1 PAS domain S-box-containing protein/diguanylate cyclase (GGDEF) domain-containing protein [Roseateles sp. YR242]
MERLLPRPPTSLRHLAGWLIAGNVLVAGVLALVTWSTLSNSREGSEAIARQSTESLASSLSVEVASELKVIDNALSTMAVRYRSADAANVARATQEVLIEQRGLLHHVRAIRIADAQGHVSAGLAPGENAINVGDRPYFLQAMVTDAMVISEPLRSRVTNEWSLILARRLLDRNGQFNGVAYAVITADHFVNLFSKVAVGQSGAISLRKDDLRLVARFSAAEPNSTKGFGEVTISDTLRRELARNPVSSSYITATALDQVERVTAYRQVPGYPMTVFAGMATHEFLGHWRQHALEQSLLVAAVVLTIAGISGVVFSKHRKERLARLEASRLAREQSLMLENDLIGMVRLHNRVFTWENRALERIFGYDPGELQGKAIRELYLDDSSYTHIGRIGYAALAAGERFRTQLQMRRKDGEAIWIDLCGTAVSETESLWMLVDIDTLKRSEEHAYGLAFRDALTGLPNRRLFEEKLGDALAHAQRANHRLAVSYVDLDGFKPINDVHGHEAGDKVLREVGKRLLIALRGNDVVARLGGDEFALVLNGIGHTEDLRMVLQRCLSSIEEPILLDSGQVVRVSASLGAVMSKGGTLPAAELMRQADEAMYGAKRAGKGRVQLYTRVERPTLVPKSAA